MKRLLALTLSVVMLLSIVVPMYANASGGGFETDIVYDDIFGTGDEKEITPVVIEITEKQGVQAIYNALNDARYDATEESPYVIRVGSGNFTLTKAFHIYSNTALISEDDTYYVQSKKDNMLKVGTTGKDPVSGYGYKNIHVYGGDWDLNDYSATMFKFVHATNCSLKNVVARNIYNAHYVETAGVDGLDIDHCTFNKMHVDIDAGTEAIQIDVLSEDHIAGYANLDNEIDYLCKNISITNCYFDRAKRAIASHTALQGKYFENITISNNYFNDTVEKSILCCNMKNLVIDNNKIYGDGVGIELKTMDVNGNGFYLSAKDRRYDNKPNIEDLNAVISNNRIVSSTNHCIYLNGMILEKGVHGDGDPMPAGNYYIKGVTIKSNKISYITGVDNINDSRNNKCCIKAQFVDDVTIDDNYTTPDSTAKTTIYVTDGSTNVSVDNNTINSVAYNAIRVCNLNDGYPKGSFKSISNNTIKRKTTFGIRISDTAGDVVEGNYIKYANTGISIDINETSLSVNKVSKNEIDSKIGIVQSKSTVGEISYNTIYTSYDAIDIEYKSVTRNIYKNDIIEPGGTGIYCNKSLVYEIKNNVITDTKEFGIYCCNGYGAGEIMYNTINGSDYHGICAKDVDIDYIDYNEIYACDDYGIYINGRSTATNIDSIDGNRIFYCYQGLKVLYGSSVDIYVNTFRYNTDCNRYVINGSTQYKLGNVSTPSLSARKSGRNVNLSFYTNGMVNRYAIYRSTSPKSGFKRIDNLYGDETGYTDYSMASNYTYYYRVLPYYVVPGTYVRIFGDYASSGGISF